MNPQETTPLKLVPPIFFEYVRFPLKLAYLWSLLFTVFFVGLSFFPRSISHSSESLSSSSSSTGYSTTVSIPSPFSISLRSDEDKIIIDDGPYSGSIAVKEGTDSLVLLKGQERTASLKLKNTDNGLSKELYDTHGVLQFVTKPDDDGYKVLTADRSLVSRVKFKEEKFNIYNASGARIYYGKEKKGSILIRNDAGSDIAWITASNSPPLTQIAPLCLPLDEQYRVLLYASELLLP